MIFSQIFEMINLGLVILDGELNVVHWNRWMALHSGLSAEEMAGRPILVFFPNLDTPRFRRNCKSVLTFGNLCFFSQRLHRYLFPFKPDGALVSRFEHMQQSCTMGPLRDDKGHIKYLYISVEDVTDVAAYEQRLVEMNLQDALTEIHNRRFLESQLEDEFERSVRYGRPLSVVFIDLDHFKSLNDRYGHQCGDAVLKAIAHTVALRMRKTDHVARYAQGAWPEDARKDAHIRGRSRPFMKYPG